MKRETNILLLACLLSVITPLTVQPQTQLPDDKKKELHKLDPTDVYLPPQERKRGRRDRDRDRRQNSRGIAPVLGSSSGQETPSGRSSGSDNSSAATPTPSPTPTATPEPTPALTAEAAVSPTVLSASQSSVQPPTATSNGKLGGMESLSITVIVTILGLILLALVVALVKLKNQLRSP
jgi:hypothetical protein